MYPNFTRSRRKPHGSWTKKSVLMASNVRPALIEAEELILKLIIAIGHL